MAAKTLAFTCFLFAVVNIANSQCLNRIIPGCAQNLLPVTEALLPNQVLLNSGFGPAVPNLVDVPYGVETLVPNQMQMPATTIIQDSTVANNLANALQLLVVSNLLSNTLPSANEVVIPGYGSPIELVGNMLSPVASQCGYGPYNYIY